MSAKRLCTLSLLLSFSLPAWAQTDTTDFSPRLGVEMLAPVEVRALRVGKRDPFVHHQLGKAEIQKNNLGQDLPYVLQYTPSAVVTSDAGNGVGYTGIRIRGTDGVRMNVTLNGIPMNDAESQGTFFVNFADLASSTGSVQLQRGVGPSTYGSPSFGASMSIHNLEQMDSAGAEWVSSFGSFQTWRQTLKAGTGKLKHGFQFDLRLSRLGSQGFIDRSASDLRALQFIAGWEASPKTSLKFMVMTGKEKTGQAWNGTPEAKVKGDEVGLLEHYERNKGMLYFSSQDSTRLFSASNRKYNYFTYEDQTDNYQQDYYQGFLHHQFSSHWRGHVGLFLTRGRGFYKEFREQATYSTYGLQNPVYGADTVQATDLIRELWLDNYYYGGVFSLLYQKDLTRLTFGGGLYQYQGDHYGFIRWASHGGVPADHRWYLVDALKTDGNLYGRLQQQWGSSLHAFADLQLRSVDYQIFGFRDFPDLMPRGKYLFFNPKLGLSYYLKESGIARQKLYLSGAVSNKEPNRNDFETAANEQPRPERLYDIEGGFSWETTRGSLLINGFYMHYKDQLILTGQINDVGAYTRRNVDRSYRAGLELVGGYQLFPWWRMDGNLSLSRNRISNFIEYMDDYDLSEGGQRAIHHGETNIAFSPSVVGYIGATFMPFRQGALQPFALELLGKHVGSQYLDNTSNPDRKLDAYSLIDLRLRYTWVKGPWKEMGLFLHLQNLGNLQYESNGYTYSYYYGGETITENFLFPQAGMNWMAGLSMKW